MLQNHHASVDVCQLISGNLLTITQGNLPNIVIIGLKMKVIGQEVPKCAYWRPHLNVLTFIAIHLESSQVAAMQ